MNTTPLWAAGAILTIVNASIIVLAKPAGGRLDFVLTLLLGALIGMSVTATVFAARRERSRRRPQITFEYQST